jgi:hypothetical protein
MGLRADLDAVGVKKSHFPLPGIEPRPPSSEPIAIVSEDFLTFLSPSREMPG